MHTQINPKPAGIEQAAMLVATWGELAGFVARLVRARPVIAAHLMLAPSRAIHATAVYLHHAVASGYADEVIGIAVERLRPRDLLREALPAMHPRLFRLLDRAGPQAKPLIYYKRLDAGLHGSASALLLRAKHLGTNTLDVADLIAADPILFAAGVGLDESLFGVQCIETALAYVRALGLAHDIESLPRGAGLPALVRRIETDLGRGHPLPAPFPVPAGWRPVATVAELWALGRELQNCVGGMRGSGMNHVSSYLEGEEVILVSVTEPIVMASIVSAGSGLWHVAQCVGPRNAPAPFGTRDGLERALKHASVPIVHMDCADALQHVTYRIEGRARRHRGRIFDDALDL